MADHDEIPWLNLEEDQDYEFKAAQGGLPNSLWETYSAMANTAGGQILLGIVEGDTGPVILGIPNPAKLKKDFWDTINNPNKVSLNLLSPSDLVEEHIQGK